MNYRKYCMNLKLHVRFFTSKIKESLQEFTHAHEVHYLIFKRFQVFRLSYRSVTDNTFIEILHFISKVSISISLKNG